MTTDSFENHPFNPENDPYEVEAATAPVAEPVCEFCGGAVPAERVEDTLYVCLNCQPETERPDEVDDSVKFCPECETPNQFGELCSRCRNEA